MIGTEPELAVSPRARRFLYQALLVVEFGFEHDRLTPGRC